jgi:hypothetical protein
LLHADVHDWSVEMQRVRHVERSEQCESAPHAVVSVQHDVATQSLHDVPFAPQAPPDGFIVPPASFPGRVDWPPSFVPPVVPDGFAAMHPAYALIWVSQPTGLLRPVASQVNVA